MKECELVDGWDARIAAKTGAAGVCGVILGSVLYLRKRTVVTAADLVKMSATSAASLSLLSFVFSGGQELSGAVTCSDTPLNSTVGGAAAGALLFFSHSRPPALGGALIGSMGCLLDVIYRSVVYNNHSKDILKSQNSQDGLATTVLNALKQWVPVRKTTTEERAAFLEERRKKLMREE
eukprot:jgi/Picsp_1/5386/NSC_02746-R1_---NA---